MHSPQRLQATGLVIVAPVLRAGVCAFEPSALLLIRGSLSTSNGVGVRAVHAVALDADVGRHGSLLSPRD